MVDNHKHSSLARPDHFYERIIELVGTGEYTIAQLARAIGVSRQALHDSLQKYLARTGRAWERKGVCIRCGRGVNVKARELCGHCCEIVQKRLPPAPKGLLTTRQAGEYMGYTSPVESIRQHVKAGRLLPVAKHGQTHLYAQADLDQLVEQGYGDRDKRNA